MWAQSLGWEEPLEKETATQFQYSCLGNNMHSEAWWATVHSVSKLDMTEHAYKKVQIEQWNSHLHGHICNTTVFTFLISLWISENFGTNCHQFKGSPVGNSILTYFPD